VRTSTAPSLSGLVPQTPDNCAPVSRAPRALLVWRLSLGPRFALWALLVLSAVFLVLYFQLVRRELQRLVDSKMTAGQMLADVVARELQAPLEFRDDDAIAAELRKLDGSPAIRSVQVWDDGSEAVAVLGVIDPAPRPLGSSILVQADKIAIGRSVLSRAGRAIGEVRVELSLDAERAAYRRARLDLFLGATVVALGTSALLVGVVRREIVLPLRRVARAAAAIGRGERTARADSSRGDEIGDLAAAFNRMAGSLEDRELRLEASTQSLRELVDHMRQAIVAFDADGRVVSEASREARRLFGSTSAREATSGTAMEQELSGGDGLKGRSVRELLYGDAPEFDVDVRAFDEWRELAFATAPGDWEQVADLAPKELVVGRDGVPVTLEFRPIVRQGRVLNVMLLLTDVSHERSLERAVQTKDEEYGRRLKAMRRLLLGGSQTLVAFVESAKGRLSESLEMIAACGDVLPSPTIDALFRAAHTVRGEARSFDMRNLEKDTERLEAMLDELRADARGSGHALTEALRSQLVDAFRAVLGTLHEERDLFAEASPIGRAIFTQTTVQIDDLTALTSYAERVGGKLRELVGRLRARPLGESAAGVLESAPTWAAAEGKRVEVLVEHGDVALDPDLVGVLPGVLTHLVRNAIAHGIETPEERRVAGKASDGLIRVAARKDAEGVTSIVVEDDGRGIDTAALGRVARDPATPIEEVIFAPGVSTRQQPDDLAGRGVGLDAVRTDLARIGYAVSVETEVGRFTRFVVKDTRSQSLAALANQLP
jgi:two-component system, chemotaxis family, sensor kinase CheA